MRQKSTRTYHTRASFVRISVNMKHIVTVGLGWAALASISSAAPKASQLVVEIENRGSLTIELFTEKAPLATSHIAELARAGFYDGLKFFRVVRSPRPFLAQTGDPNTLKRPLGDSSIGEGGSGKAIPFEDTGEKHTVGAVGLAMKPNKSGVLMGDSQFYIMLGSAGFLDGKYTVFGRVSKGQDLLEKIQEGDVMRKVTFVQG